MLQITREIFTHDIFKDSLLNAIKNDQVFGFVQCDVRSPKQMIDKHLRNGFLFPPVVSRQIIDKSMLSPYMNDLVAKNGDTKTGPTPIQSYHGKQLFLMTPLVQLYIKLGLKITNITRFIQFVPGKALLPFANKVVKLRSEATDDGDDAKQLTAKLFGNAGITCRISHAAYHMLYIIC